MSEVVKTFQDWQKSLEPRREIIYGVTDRRNDPLLVKINDFLVDHARVSKKEKGLFFHSLELLVGSGVSFTRAIYMIASRVRNLRLARVLYTVHYDMEKNGMSFSTAIEKYPSVFSRTESRMIRAGELTGKIEETLMSVSDQIQKNLFLDLQIRKALLYPISVLFALLLAMIVSLVFVIPKFVGFFQEFDAELPLPTLILVKSSEIFTLYWWAFLLGSIFLWGFFRNWRNSEEGALAWDGMLLRAPGISGLVNNIQTFRITTHFSVLLSSGIPVSKALKTLAEIIPNTVIAYHIFEIEKKVSSGIKMSQAFFECPFLDPVLGEVIEVGEASGKISEGLRKMTGQYQMEVESQLRNLTALIEPFTIVMVAVCVGFMAFAILLPIFRIQELMSTV